MNNSRVITDAVESFMPLNCRFEDWDFYSRLTNVNFVNCFGRLETNEFSVINLIGGA